MSKAKESRLYSRLVATAKQLEEEYESRLFPEQWSGSPFEWLKIGLPAPTRGKAAEVLVERWLSSEGFEVGAAKGTDADLVVNGVRVEVKSSTLWDKGTYRFQQVRNQNYEMVICIGFSPSEAHCWVLSKKLAYGQSSPQHGGAKGGSGVRWIDVDPKAPPSWLSPRYGGLQDAVDLIHEATVQRDIAHVAGRKVTRCVAPQKRTPSR